MGGEVDWLPFKTVGERAVTLKGMLTRGVHRKYRNGAVALLSLETPNEATVHWYDPASSAVGIRNWFVDTGLA